MEPVEQKASRFLLDTHVLLWWLVDDPKLSDVAHHVIEDSDNTILVSSASMVSIFNCFTASIYDLANQESCTPRFQ